MRLVTLAALVLVTMLSNSASDIPPPLLCLLSTLPAPVVAALLLLLLVALRAGMVGMVDACDGMEARVDVDDDAATAPLV